MSLVSFFYWMVFDLFIFHCMTVKSIHTSECQFIAKCSEAKTGKEEKHAKTVVKFILLRDYTLNIM